MPYHARTSRRSVSGFTFQSALRDMRRDRTSPSTACLPAAAPVMLAVLRRLDRAFAAAAEAGRHAPDIAQLQAIRSAARAAIVLAESGEAKP
ncbi:MAG: hypothetical protein ABWY78_15235 [Microvirga sp.]